MDNTRECAMCGNSIALALVGGFDWPSTVEDTLCWSCQDAEIDRLREALEIYADEERWGYMYMTCRWFWRGVDDQDFSSGWRVAKEALRSPWRKQE